MRAHRLLAAIVAALTLAAVPGAARANEDEEHHEAPKGPPPPKNLVFADLGLHVIGLGYQRTVAPHVALAVSANFYDAWTATEKLGDIRGGVLRLRPYFYFSDQAPKGAWLSPFIQGGVVMGKRDGQDKTGPAGALGASIGYAFLFGGRFHLSLGIGGQLHFAQVAGASAPSFYTAGIHADATLGVAF